MSNNMPNAEELKKDEAEKNFIDLHIHKIAVDRSDTSLVEKIKSEITVGLRMTRNRLGRYLNNSAEPNWSEMMAIASILSRYRQTKPEDLLKNPNKETPHQSAAHE